MICLLCHSIGPYHSARYRQLSSVLEDFVVVELSLHQSGNPWINTGSHLKGKVYRLFDEALCKIPKALQSQKVQDTLSVLKPEVVVSVGYSETPMRTAALWAKKHGSFSIMMTDTWRGDRKRFLPLEIAKAFWCNNYYDAFFISGIRSYEYFRSLKISDEKIWRGVDVVDNDHFEKHSQEVRNEADVYRKNLNLPEKYFLCCARLSKEKNIETLINAYHLYNENGGQWELVIVGDGPLRNSLYSKCKEINGVHMVGWQQYPILPAYYALASCFILPSISEPWGLVVNEAMASSLPLLISRKCGCFPELLWRGINGYDFDPTDASGLAKLMTHVSRFGSFKLREMGFNSRQIISNHSLETWSLSLLDCVNKVMSKK